VRRAYLATIDALRQRALPTFEVSSRVRATKSPDEYAKVRDSRRELTYEALIAGGRTRWRVGDRFRIYRTAGGGNVVPDPDDESQAAADWIDRRDYDVAHYIRILRDNFASRLERAFAPEDFAAVFADPDQPSLFDKDLSTIRPVLRAV
jgi:hypothetical protein